MATPSAGLFGADVLVPAFEITVSGVPLLPNEAARVTGLSINTTLNTPSTFSISLNNQDFYFLGKGKARFAEGTLVTIAIGYVSDPPLTPMIVGEVTRLDAEFPTDASPTLTVTGFDLMHRLTTSTHPQAGAQKTAPDLVKQVAQGLEVSIDPRIGAAVGAKFEYLAQTMQHDLDFLTEWATRLGWVLWMEGKTLHVAPGEVPLKEELVLQWGRQLTNLSASFSIAGLVQRVEVRGRKPSGNQEFVGRAQLPPDAVPLQPTAQGRIEGTQRHFIDPQRLMTQADADAVAAAHLQRLVHRTTTVSGACMGTPALRAGVKVRLEGIERFERSYQVLTATHTVGSNGYQTSFTVGLGAETGAGGEFGETGAAPDQRISGVMRGVVTTIKDDGNLGRVKVRFIDLPPDVISDWAPVATPMAGPQRGMMLTPEIDDQVLVAFEQGDFHRPYILGGLWHEDAMPPESGAIDAEGKNVIKRVMKSRAGHIIRLDDTEDAEKIEIIDKSGKNLINIDTKNNKITIHSEKDIVLDAPQGKVTITASDLEVTATNKGTLEGAKGIDVKAPQGNVNVTGTKVNLN